MEKCALLKFMIFFVFLSQIQFFSASSGGNLFQWVKKIVKWDKKIEFEKKTGDIKKDKNGFYKEIKKDFSVENGCKLTLESFLGGKIVLNGKNDSSNVSLTYKKYANTKKSLEDIKVDIGHSKSEISISAKNNKKNNGKIFIGSNVFIGCNFASESIDQCGVDFNLTVPKKMLSAFIFKLRSANLNICDVNFTKNFSVKSSSGDTKIKNIVAQAVCVESSSGDNVVSNITADFSAKTSSGKIELKDIKGFVKAKSTSGNISGYNIEKDITVGSASGDVEFFDVNGNVDSKTTSGNITARDIQGFVKAKSSSGDITGNSIANNVNVRSTSGDVEFFDVKGDMNAETTSGNITAKDIKGLFKYKTTSGNVTKY